MLEMSSKFNLVCLHRKKNPSRFSTKKKEPIMCWDHMPQYTISEECHVLSCIFRMFFFSLLVLSSCAFSIELDSQASPSVVYAVSILPLAFNAILTVF